VTFLRLGGIESAKATARERSGGAYSPKMVEVFCAQAGSILNGLDQEPSWDALLQAEPGERIWLSEDELDGAFEAIADYTDIKSPWFLNHSRNVADLAERAATKCVLPAADCQALRRAALVHDIGKVGISAGVWGRQGALSEREWEQVRLHPYYTGRVFARSEPLAKIGALAASHHEKLDSSGYHRNLAANMLSPAARILCAANAYQATLEARPHRAARSPEQAAEQLLRDVKANKLDGDCVNAVLSVAVGDGTHAGVNGEFSRCFLRCVWLSYHPSSHSRRKQT
jgi:HD-GYP domain-containing protein (c-di-GMP phosphodiesterase class II)